MHLDSTFLGLGHLRSTPPSVRALRAVLGFGCLALGLIWALESAAELLTPLDRWAYPLMLVVFGLALVDALRARDQAVRAKTAACATAVAYLVSAWHLTIFDASAALDMYRVTVLLVWMGLVHASLFVFFEQRAALTSSLTVYMGTYAPVALAMAVAPPHHWPAQFPILVVNVALATATSLFLLAAVSRLQREHQVTSQGMRSVRRQSMTDALTGLPNRRALQHALKRAFADMEAGAPVPLTVLLIDADRFKSINDRFGHDAGDAVLVHLGSLLGRNLRSADMVGRWGGEEFLCVLPAAGREIGLDLAERMRAAVSQHRFSHGEQVTISLGMAQGLPGEDPSSLVMRADRALYAAKHGGRNRVALADLARA